MSKAQQLPLIRYISERRLAEFLRQVFCEEERLSHSVRSIDCEAMLKLKTKGGTTKSALQRLLRRLVQEGYLAEDRKDMRIILVGYTTTTQAITFIHDQLKPEGSLIPCQPDNQPLREIKKLALAAASRTLRATQEDPSNSLLPNKESEWDRSLRVASDRVDLAYAERESLRARLEVLQKKLELDEQRSSSREFFHTHSALGLQKMKLEISILRQREKEESERLERAVNAYNALISSHTVKGE